LAYQPRRFECYWEASLHHVAVDDTTRSYLYGIASLAFLPIPLRWIFGSPYRFITTGFLPDSLSRPARFGVNDRQSAELRGRYDLRCPGQSIMRVPDSASSHWNIVLRDTRRRISDGRSIV